MVKLANVDDRLLTSKEVAYRWRCSEKKLRNDRRKGVGSPFIKLSSGMIRYREADVIAFENSQRAA